MKFKLSQSLDGTSEQAVCTAKNGAGLRIQGVRGWAEASQEAEERTSSRVTLVVH
jgi:hypothetical protein